jgi:hypothetical protein
VIRGVTGYTTAKVTSGHGLIYQQIEGSHGIDKARAVFDRFPRCGSR